MLPDPAPARPTPADADLLARLRAQDRGALEILYDRHARYALGIAFRVLRDRAEAEEVVQDVFLQLWNQALRYDERRGLFTSWLFVMARNRALDRVRSRASRARAVAAVEAPETSHRADAEDTLVDREQRHTVLAALAQLPTGQRQAIELAFYGGLTHSEIARETGEPLGTVKSRIGRAMAALRQTLAEPS